MTLAQLSSHFEPWLKNTIPDSFPFHLKGAVGSFHSFVITHLASRNSHILIITETDEQERFLRSDLRAISDTEVVHLPPSGKKPYDQQQIVDSGQLVQRSEALQKLQQSDRILFTTSADALFEKVAPPEQLDQVSILLEKGMEIPPAKLQERLADQGYRPVRFVDQPGEYAVRGGIFDVFPFSGEYPLRLEFFGDELESIREFDADSQRSVAFLNQARIVPDLTNLPDSEKSSLLDYFPDHTLVITIDEALIIHQLNEKFEDAENAFDQSDADESASPEFHYVNGVDFLQQVSTFSNRVFLGTPADRPEKLPVIQLPLQPQPDFHGNFKLLRENISTNSEKGMRTLILCDNEGQQKRFEELLGDTEADFNYQMLVNSLHEGFIAPTTDVAVYTDHQIFNRYHRPNIKKRRYSGGISFKELKDLSIGDFVVHVDYGIGKFAGFKKISVKDNEQEVVVLRYQEDSLLYVNVSSLHKLQKYSGKEGTAPRITRLGSGEWARKKAQTRKKVKDIARELIRLYAKRKMQQAFAFSGDSGWQTEMEARFEYEETPDQDTAIQAVKQDMESTQPMDRLVCGDVGFGKTEVAVRAAFKAVMDHKQVAVLVPTTILAEQHAKTFKKRMEQFPVTIEALSRFRSKAEQKEVTKKLEAGKIDIVIGTHRLLSADVKFKELGLMIIDEEQRFGVSAKEKLKAFRATIDVLTLTATPIPRTLQFSLMGARDLSVINTPPPNRQPVYTEIHSFNEELIRDAIIQEISRGGQVFFIHNRVSNIEEVAEMLRRLVPDIRVRFAHGQMTGSQLEKIISDFYTHKFDVLVSTNIVENGIDIANANTMIINRADRFGLAELHQLRGRVGRSNRKAFCYLITQPIETLTAEARKRLLALEEFSDLGSGFNIAMRDLDIRGAGDILGGEQSGFINDIGFELYTKILNDAVRELKETEFSEMFEMEASDIEKPETTVEFDSSALLPADYVSDNVERLNLYRKLAGSKTETEINDWKEEVADRFGPLPDAAQTLVTASRIKLAASACFFTKVTIRAGRMWCVCPKADTDLGTYFFDQGIFQQTLDTLESIEGHPFEVVHKKDLLRLVIRNINGYDDALQFLKTLNKSREKQEVA